MKRATGSYAHGLIWLRLGVRYRLRLWTGD
jgi:hypothetical protein